MKELSIIATMSIITILLRGLPFMIIKKEPPRYIDYLGRVLPSAIIGMLVVYCLKDVNPVSAPYGIPELIAVVCVVAIHAWKRNSIVSILSGTVIYMILLNIL